MKDKIVKITNSPGCIYQIDCLLLVHTYIIANEDL